MYYEGKTYMADNKLSKSEQVKQRTLEIYESLPQDKEQRMKCLDARDEIVELNYAFFGYVATHTYIHNSSVTYEDKFQSALMHFCECWWWYKWKGDENHKGYRQDLSFTVFFKPRVGEMIERELNEVKYSVRRSLCMEAGAQLGKHWGKVRYEDLSKVNLPADKLNSLKAIFGTVYWADLETSALFIEAPKQHTSILDTMNDNYNSLEELLIHEMVSQECRLTDDKLYEMADIYGLDFWELKRLLPGAEKKLRTALQQQVDFIED